MLIYFTFHHVSGKVLNSDLWIPLICTESKSWIVYFLRSHDDFIKSNGNIYALLAICAGTAPVPGEFPAQRPVTLNFDIYFDLRLNKRLSKQS